MSSVHFCLTSKNFFICSKAFILGTFKTVRINPLKNIHFSDKVGVGGSSPLNPTKNKRQLEVIAFFCIIKPPDNEIFFIKRTLSTGIFSIVYTDFQYENVFFLYKSHIFYLN